MNKLLVDAAAAKQASKGCGRKDMIVTQPATNMSSFSIFHNHIAITCKQKLQSHTQPFCKHTSHNTLFVLLQENQTVL
jgi:hypothetical protein